MVNTLNITWEKCHHGVEKRSFIPCEECRKEKESFKLLAAKNSVDTAPARIPIRRGCSAQGGQCFCNGSCQEIVGYRDPLFVGER